MQDDSFCSFFLNKKILEGMDKKKMRKRKREREGGGKKGNLIFKNFLNSSRSFLTFREPTESRMC